MTMLPPDSLPEPAREAAVLGSPVLDITDATPWAEELGTNPDLGTIPRVSLQDFPVNCTLHEVVEALSEVTPSEDEVLATLCHMLDSGRIRLRAGLGDLLPEALPKS